MLQRVHANNPGPLHSKQVEWQDVHVLSKSFLYYNEVHVSPQLVPSK